jgi:hypothetical protein
MFFGNSVAIGSWSSTNKNQVVPINFTSALTNWAGQLSANSDARNLIPTADALSFTSFFGTTDTLASSLSGRRGSADMASLLYLLQRDIGTQNLAQVGTAILNANNHFVISAVPVPAAVVLFATGVIGLVGIARRRVLGL